MTKITFDTDTCGRCGGTGRMPFAVAGGVCFGCSGAGRKFTKAGAQAKAIFDEFIRERTAMSVWDLKVGMRFRPHAHINERRTVVEGPTQDPLNPGHVTVITPKVTMGLLKDQPVFRLVTIEDIEAAAEHLAMARMRCKRPGFTVTRPEPEVGA